MNNEQHVELSPSENPASITPPLKSETRSVKKFAVIIFVFVAVVSSVFYVSQHQFGDSVPEVYTLVPDKLSQSAAIPVALPEDIHFSDFNPEEHVHFSPEIKGKWEEVQPGETRFYRFLPSEKLAVGTYYLASLDTPEIKMEKMFSIDSDPSVLAVFPKSEVEVDETSNITIMFNRPIVPLSTLSENADMVVPVTITPNTKGRFKWITTRTLQFIPETRLLRSSQYRVEVGRGLLSLDGVKVPPFSHTFTTRTLQYGMGLSNEVRTNLSHSQPIQIFFNQPFDLSQTIPLISLSVDSGAPAPFVASYGTRVVRNEKTGKQETLTDQSVLEVYLEKDSHGRKYLWNFGGNYRLDLRGAIPKEGDIALSTSFHRLIHAEEVITQVSATSPRSSLVTPEVFDPLGKLVFRMSEPIDLTLSKIEGKGITQIDYDEQCRTPGEGEEVSLDESSCAKVSNKQVLLISFDPEQLSLGETSTVVFRKLVNTDGVTLSPEVITKSFTTYKKFTVTRSTPGEGGENSSLSELILCSSNPISEPPEKDFYQKVRSNMMIGMWNWVRSNMVTTFDSPKRQEQCPVGTFLTTIQYGLVPKYDYALTLSLDDHFGQHIEKEIHFRTKDADGEDKRIVPMQPAVSMTPPTRTTLTYGLDFLDSVDVTVCKVSAETMLSYRSFWPKVTQSADDLSCLGKATKHIVLPKSYATRKYVQIDLKEYFPDILGNYVVVLSNPENRLLIIRWDKNERVTTAGKVLYEKSFVTVTNLAIGSKQIGRVDYRPNLNGYSDVTRPIPSDFMTDKWPKNLYWVNDFHTLTPSRFALVTPYQNTGNSLTALKPVLTDDEGIAETTSAEDIIGAVVSLGNDSAIVSNNTDSISYPGRAEAVRKEFIYTDRPIYRPGDTVHIKGISRIGYDATYEVGKGKTKVSIRDASYQVIKNNELEFNANGTYETSFVIDGKAPLGNYLVSSDTGGFSAFQVEEYVAPSFQVTITPNKEEYVSGETAKLNVSADYYFGVPVDSGDVEYRIVSQDYYFDRYHDAYFQFGQGWYDRWGGWYGDQYVTSGKLTLDSSGKTSLSQDLQIDKLFSGDYRTSSKVLTMYVTVKNGNGQSVSSSHSFILHRGNFYPGITMDDYFFVSGKTGVAKLKTVDTNGVPVSKKGLTLTLNRVEWKSYKRQEVDGNFYYRTERVTTKVSDSQVETDEKGNATKEFTAGSSGQYEFVLSGVDEAGNKVSAKYGFYVAGSGNVSARQTNNATLDLDASQKNLRVGDTGSLVIASPFPRAKALVTIVRGKIFERKILDITAPFTQYQFQITKEEIPGVSAQVLLLAPDPEVKYGELFYHVDTKEKSLEITISPNKKEYVPGEEVTLDVHVKDAEGNPIQAELSLSVVDMSVLALVGNPKKNPIDFFYGGEPISVQTSINVKNILHIADIPVGTKGGGGGADDVENKVRGVFRDTAHWEGSVSTGKDGNAIVRFTLPDNLTKWQVESVGATKDTMVGAGYAEFTSRKHVMVVPLRPRFVLPGDTFAVGGTVFNESDQKQKLDVSVVSSSLVFSGNTKVSVTIEPHSSVSVSFPAAAPEHIVSGLHEFTLSAKNSAYQDTVVNSFPIKENTTNEFVATGGRITDDSWREQLYLPKNIVTNRGELSVSVSATRAGVLQSAISTMLIYPYECSEQVASKLRMIAIVKQREALFASTTSILPSFVSINGKQEAIDRIVEVGLAKLYQNESAFGGVSYYPNTPENYWVTLATLSAYIDLREAGYHVDDTKLMAAAQYIFQWINYPEVGRQPSKEDIIESAYVLSRLKDKRFERDATRQTLEKYAQDKKLVSRGLSTPALSYLAMYASQEHFSDSDIDRLYAEFENRSHIDARGTTVSASIESPSENYENSIVNTALALKAFSKAKRESPVLEGYVRAIKNSKSRDGGWASTYNSITVIDAVTEYVKWKDEANAHMSLALTLDNTSLFDVEVNHKNIESLFSTSVPIHLVTGGVNHVLQFSKKELGKSPSAYYYDLLLKYFLPTAEIAPRDEGFSVRRNYYHVNDADMKNPLDHAHQGDVLRARVIISTPTLRSNVSIEDYIPAGVEIVNQKFATEDQTLEDSTKNRRQEYGFNGGNKKESSWFSSLAQVFSFGTSQVGPVTHTDGMVSDETYSNKSTALIPLYPTAIENHDDRIYVYVSSLSPGEYVYEYFVRALVPGKYQHLPLVVSELYTPENFGRTSGSTFEVIKKEK